MSAEPLIGPVDPPHLHVMTFNIRRRTAALTARPADRWSNRRPRVRALLQTERPSLLGLQEALPDQTRTIAAALGRDYRFIGYGRHAGRRGEACPLFYDTDRLELLYWRQTALSDTPGISGSTSWGNIIPRVLVGATLRDRATDAVFLALNTHLDVFSVRSRNRAAHEIRGLVEDQPLPAIVMGDLNARAGSRAVRALLSGGTLRDAWTAADERVTPEWSTYHAYRRPRVGAKRIDWIAVSPGVQVLQAAINAQPVEGGWPSDHLPVQTVVRMPRAVGAA